MNNKLTILGVIVCTLALVFLCSSTDVYANVFASDIKVVNPDGSAFDGELNDDTPGVGIQFRLNENATSVTITVTDASSAVVATVVTGPQPQGESVVVWAGVDNAGNPVPEGDYTFTVTATDAVGHTGYDVVYAKSGTVIYTRAGTTIRNPAAPNFGHPIGGNGGGGGLKRGPLNFFADGTGFEQVEPNLSRFSPFDVRDHGGSGRLYMITSDDDGNLYYSDRLDPLNKIYRFAPDLDPASLKVIATSDDSSKKGLGIDVVGTGANRTVYWGLDSTVVRFTIGEADTFDAANFEVVAEFEPDTTGGDTNDVFIRDIVIDDSGYMYVTQRRGTPVTGTGPGLAVEKYDISGALPVSRTDRLWTIPVGFDTGDGRPIGFGIDRGDDLTSNTDDRIYFSNGASGPPWNGINKIDDLATGGSTVVFEDISGTGGTSSHADISVDAAGNLIFFENSSEWLIAVSPPDGPNSFTTPANDVISIDDPTTANAHPQMASVDDVPNDQGNQVLVSWAGSFNDRLGNAGIDEYEVYRKVEDNAAKAATLNSPPGSWELVGTTSASQTSNYHLTVATLFNKTLDSTPLSTFYVSAVGTDGTRWDSNPASGTSEDNLVPTAPANVIASEGSSEQGSFAQLTWDESPDPDINYYAIVRGTVSGFEPSTAEVIGKTAELQFDDENVNIGESLFYRIVAFDFSGNQGEFSDETTLMITDVAGSNSLIPSEFALDQNFPNPFNPDTQISYDLPSSTDVFLKIYNIMGQEVRTIVDETQPAGQYTVLWDGKNNYGTRVSSGIYVYVIKAGDFVKSKRMTLLK